MASVPAVVAPRPLPVDDPECLVDAEIEVGAPGPHDLLVDVRAVSVNPVDGKVRSSFDAADGPKVLGFDAAGVVVEVGDRVQGYAPGDEVYYAGATPPGRCSSCPPRAGSGRWSCSSAGAPG